MTRYRKSWTQVIEEVQLYEALKPLDKSVVDAFYYKKEKAGKVVSTDGDSLWKNGLGGQEIAIWTGRKIKITAVSDVKSTESIIKYIRKSIPSGILEEVEEGVTGPTRMDVQKHFDKEKGLLRVRINATEKALKISDMKVDAKGTVQSFKEEVELDEKWEVGVVYHQDFGGGEVSYFRADSLLKNRRWKGMAVDEYSGKQKKPRNITADEKTPGWKITPKDKIPKGLKEEVEIEEGKTYLKVNLKKLKKEYEDNEDKNNHTENYLLLAKAFGTSAEVKKVQEIMKRNQKQGHTSKSDMDWMYKNINPYYDKIRNEEVEIEEKKAATGYELYHKDFSSAMQHAYKHAKSKGFVVDPKEIDDKVATGPKKPSSGKTNRYALKAGRKTVHIQVANLDNKRYELNMYIEDYDKNQLLRVKHDEALIAEAGDICSLNRGVLRSKSMQAVWEKKCAPKLNNQTLGEKDMEKLVDTVRRVLVGEDSDKDDPGTQGDKAEYQKKRKEVAKKFGVESCSALKDEAKRKECYNALDKAHVADHEEQVFLHNMNKKEESKKKVTESTGLQMKMAFDDADIKVKGAKGGKLVIDRNDQRKVLQVLTKSLKKGTDVKKAIQKFIKFEEVEDQVDPNPSKTVSKLFSHVRNLMKK